MTTLKKLLAILLLLININSNGQPVLFEDLVFNSEFEKLQFELIRDGQPDYFDLFLALDPLVTSTKATEFKSVFKSNVTTIQGKKYLQKSNDKKIKGVYNDVHDEFLEKYELQNRFSSVFSNGNYNCVSASALYALIFEYISIPYSIKEKPTHVYLMAFPNNDQLLVEATDPTGSFFNYNDRFKATVVGRLKDAKLISEGDYSNKTVDEIFNAFYYSDDNIELRELAGIQYLNDALYKLEANQTAAAYQQLKKSYYLYPKENISSMLVFLNVQLINEIKYANNESMKYLVELSRLDGNGITLENIIAEFDHMTHLILTEKADTSTYSSYYNHFISQSSNQNLNKEISYLYHIRKGMAHYTLGDNKTAIQHTGQAYLLKPDNLEINRIFISMITDKLSSVGDNKLVVKELHQLERAYPGLKNNNMFRSLLGNAYLIEFGQSFDFGDAQNGEKYKALYENIFSEDLNINHSNLGRAYSMAAVYYFKQGQKSKARNILEQGLQYSPGNYELLTRKRMIR